MTDTAETEPADAPFGAGIAIVGMAARFPGARDLPEFWANLRDGVESIVSLSDEELLAAGVAPEMFKRADYVKAWPRFEGLADFDAEFFGYSAREAQVMDPQHRLFLETAWQALESSGYDPGQYDGRIGVFGGSSTSAYLENIVSNLEQGRNLKNENAGLAFELSFLTSRVSYKLGLRGPSFPVQTACSTSLVALHAACQSLLSYECDMALAGAVSYKVRDKHGYRYQEGSFLSPDGHVRPFDARARGTVFGNGVGVIVLKRVEDAQADSDTLHAVIKGSAVNNDGGMKSSFTAPSVRGQAQVIREALSMAAAAPESIDYVEAHGSGTLIGDSIEVQALSQVFGESASCGLGSVKGNVGHLDAAAGMAGLIKVVLALTHETIPPSVNYKEPNPDAHLDRTSFHVPTTATPWRRAPGRCRRAGVSAFGFGGTNAHLVLEEPPARAPSDSSPRQEETLIITARTAHALEQATDRLAAHLRGHRTDLADAAHTLARGRRHHPHRRTVTGIDPDLVAAALETRDPAWVTTTQSPPHHVPLVFQYGGQGTQRPGMAAELYHRFPVFRDAMDECSALLAPHLPADIRDVLLDPGSIGHLDQTLWAQPALFVHQYALTRLWKLWGITPNALLGHSLGEWTAACVAGVFALPDALELVALRGKLMQARSPGAMLNVMADRAAVAADLTAELALAADNGPEYCVVSGSAEAIEDFAELAQRRGWVTQPLKASHAFHSAHMRPIIDDLTAALTKTRPQAPRIPLVSNVTGTWITEEQATDPSYWARHALVTVEYAAGVRTVATTHPHANILEIGPSHTLTNLARRILAGSTDVAIHTSHPHRRHPGMDAQHLHRTLHRLWHHGSTPDWAAYYGQEHRHRIPLPLHPLSRKRHWLDVHVPRHPTPEPSPLHPLLDRLLVRSMGQSVFLTELSPDRHWILSEHKLEGEAIAPGTALLEMARAAAALHFGQTITELKDVTFLVPLLVPRDTTRTVHTVIKDSGHATAEFTIVVHDPRSGSWTLHAQGFASTRPPAAPPARQDLEELRARCGLETVDGAMLQAEHQAMEFGGRWANSLRAVHVGVRAALGRLDLPDRYRSEHGQYTLDPALLDLATGFSGFATLISEDDRRRVRDRSFFLPVGYDSLRVHAPIPATGFSFIRSADDDPSAEIRKADVLICDSSGATAIEIRGFTAKRVTDAKRTVAQLRPHGRYHVMRWTAVPPAALPGGSAAKARRLPSTVLMIGEPGSAADDVAAALRERGVRAIIATLGHRWRHEAQDRYETPPTAEGLRRLIDALAGEPLEEVVQIAAPTTAGAADGPGELDARLPTGIYALFHLVRALSDRDALPGRLSVVAPSVARVTGHERTLAPVHATLFGLAKVIGHENQGTEVRCVDVGEGSDAAAVCAELLGPGAPAVVALRQGARYVAELGPLHLPQRARTPVVQTGGVHLITGGLGGLGLAIARHLACTVPGVRLALVGRTALPPRERWSEIPATESKRQRQVAIMAELLAAGAVVRDYQGDVTDLAQMTEVIDRIRDELGPIRCVVHAAGIAGDGFILRKDLDTLRRTVEPKVLGAAVLDAVTLSDPPDLMVAFGSTASVFGTAGQGDYTAANLYLNHFAEARTADGRPTVTIGWSDWLGAGMAADHGVQHDRGFFGSLSVEDGLAGFEEIVARDGPSVIIVGEINYLRLVSDDNLAAQARQGFVTLAPSIQRDLAAAREGIAEPAPAGSLTRPGHEIPLTGRQDGEYSATERALASIWAKEFGVTELDVHTRFSRLGLDSLGALRLAQKIQKAMGIRVTMAELLRHDATIAKFAEHLDRDRR
ncbi:SDR family NAD(P)-dependent oxidoreductase [Nonomuraea sp. NPDC046802]|uniref:SDR family NAD(P)-dependent oxidoreductase n=1 Tax=Nonomuraea sp. NPDC046802 TaxID=3154919 RepID=UPI0033F45894